MCYSEHIINLVKQGVGVRMIQDYSCNNNNNNNLTSNKTYRSRKVRKTKYNDVLIETERLCNLAVNKFPVIVGVIVSLLDHLIRV